MTDDEHGSDYDEDAYPVRDDPLAQAIDSLRGVPADAPLDRDLERQIQNLQAATQALFELKQRDVPATSEAMWAEFGRLTFHHQLVFNLHLFVELESGFREEGSTGDADVIAKAARWTEKLTADN